jgi:hypothetical protein
MNLCVKENAIETSYVSTEDIILAIALSITKAISVARQIRVRTQYINNKNDIWITTN